MILTKSSKELYTEYASRMRKIADIKNSIALLEWDQETYLPVKGASFRGQQIATLSELAHEWFTTGSVGDLLRTLKDRDDLQEDEKKNVEKSLEDYNKQTKFSPGFVRLLSETVSRSFHSWIRARASNSFAVFEEDLRQLVELKKQETELAGYKDHPYNALLDNFEKGCTVGLLDKIFDEVRGPLKELLEQIRTRQQVDDSFLKGNFPKQQQWNFGMELIKEMGFDFQAGRQDISEHPFTTNTSRNDVRLTTRIDEHDFSNMTWSCIHEAGHGLYEQGLPEAYYGLPLGEYASLSIHESQSRLWENSVGRSYAWWQHWYPRLQRAFPSQFQQVSVEQFYKGINKAGASLIRTEADELSYHFHVMIRYELEKGLIEGSISVKDIPAYWKEQYANYLGVEVPDDKRGCLQDVHWSHGSFGYFPTYSLGSFYAAQLFATAEKQEGSIATELLEGKATTLLAWLRQQIHQYGRRYTSEELCLKATGETLNIQHFLTYLIDKYKKIYIF